MLLLLFVIFVFNFIPLFYLDWLDWTGWPIANHWSMINDHWSMIMQFSNMSFISMYSHVYSGIHVALLLKSVFLFICIFNSICSDLSSISSYSRLYSGMVALRKFASHANSKHLQQLQYWEDPRNWNIWCILTQKFQVNFSCVWSTFCCTLIIVRDAVIYVLADFVR